MNADTNVKEINALTEKKNKKTPRSLRDLRVSAVK